MTIGMAFPPWMTPVVSRPIALGKVFYVRHGASDDNNGVDPNTPFATITYALSQCVANRNDYIIVLDAWSETVPIVVNKTRTHIIGLACPGSPVVVLTSGAETEPIFQVYGSDACYCEIAGFDLGGGNTSGAIEGDPAVATTTDQLYIHHCNFGSEYCGSAPQNGIRLTGPMGSRTWTIESCKFMGVNGGSGGQLGASGITITGGGCHHTIKDCVFELCVAPAIEIGAGDGHVIRNNVFSCPADVNGAAIETDATTVNCLIDGNSAMRGAETAMANNPYIELNANANHWGTNFTAFAGGAATEILPA